jgi:hypothetical protein
MTSVVAKLSRGEHQLEEFQTPIVEQLALEYFKFVNGPKTYIDYRGLVREQRIPFSNGFEVVPLVPAHARYDVNHGVYNRAWLMESDHYKLINSHSYFKELFKTLGI